MIRVWGKPGEKLIIMGVVGAFSDDEEMEEEEEHKRVAKAKAEKADRNAKTN